MNRWDALVVGLVVGVVCGIYIGTYAEQIGHIVALPIRSFRIWQRRRFLRWYREHVPALSRGLSDQSLERLTFGDSIIPEGRKRA